MEVNTYKEPVYIITGGKKLRGNISIEGAKNATLPAIVAACLSNEDVELRNVPTNLNDVKRMIELIESMGVKVKKSKNSLLINGSTWTGGSLNGDIAGSIRHSLLLLGLSVAKKKNLNIPVPGGCKLGARKHDMHIDALQRLGSIVTEDNDINLIFKEINNNVDIHFYYPTFGGTINAIFAAVKKYDITTTIVNAARNPEVQDIILMLIEMGADITWKSDNTLVIKGVSKLKGVSYSIMPDRIVGATIIAAAGVTRGEVTINNFNERLLKAEISIWRKCGLIIKQRGENLYINGDVELKIIDIETSPYPGFHTDIQPLHVLLMTFAKGKSTVKETILDGRFRFTEELNKMGANIKVIDGNFLSVNKEQGQIAIINGITNLKGAEVIATDIRGGAAVALAAMAANGNTIIGNLYQLERGYSNFTEIFSKLGADVRREYV